MKFIPESSDDGTFNPKDVFNGAFIPNALLRYKGLSPGAKLCWAVLSDYCNRDGKAWPSRMAVARRLGCSVEQVKRYLRALLKHEFIKVEKRSGHSNMFKFLRHPVLFGRGSVRKNVHIIGHHN